MIKLLIVDDEAIIRTAIGKRPVWRELGIDAIQTAASVAQARDAISAFVPDFVFTDIVMPREDGFALMRYVRECFPRTRVVVLSGYNEFQFATRAMRLGACAYVLKPTDDEEIRKVFAELIAELGLEPERRAAPTGALAPAVDYVLSNYRERITLEQAAAEVCMNPSYFSACFRKQQGICFVDYVNSVRVEKAKQLLRNTNYRIYEISEMVGFRDMSYFCKVFRKAEGCSPAAWRTTS